MAVTMPRREMLHGRHKRMNEQEKQLDDQAFSQLIKLGESLLKEYEPSLNVLKALPYSEAFGATRLRVHAEDGSSLTRGNREKLRTTIKELLDQLVEKTDGFVASEPPRFDPAEKTEEGLARYKDFALRFTHGCDDTPQHTYHLWVECWFYSPAAVRLTPLERASPL